VDAVEVRWPDGETESFPGVSADALYELVRGRAVARRTATTTGLSEREKKSRFWELQRAAMDAVKRDHDPQTAIPLFRQALALDPGHEDARYYLANCLAAQSRVEEAIEELETLQRLQPQSHRAFKRAATLRAFTATTPGGLETAEEEIRRALELNPEATGALLMLGEIELLRGRFRAAADDFENACRTNPRAVGGLFLRGYIAWKNGDDHASRELLRTARQARGEDWKPVGAVAEGDVAKRMYTEETPLSRFWESWDGEVAPDAAFGPLDGFLEGWQ
jgi:tetratricopeptide (TPR) repeat protein